ncbi:DsrE/DsrF/DrsH-like family protein [Thermoactinomyces mirandus]|uniref:DsrE/DsrF/DrsH-like family protein n=1 Tax=Thermoactinomyces mirandus TaxID=2756294 RepID=A0A7W1XU67_9BACL|nr:DsrE/DsrF/DrsH-like family protein [Thermoactinomyces mirandus]MBA4603359.1 DsrE/DsrF/DrsH-like family protein [Thermoactinomyces mirandus]
MEENKNPSFAIIVMSEELEKIHAAALIGSMAAMTGTTVNFFLTMNSLKAFLKENVSEKNFKTGDVGKAMIEKDVTLFPKLLETGKEMGDLNIYCCALAMDVMGWRKEDLIDIVDDVIGITTFLNMAQNAKVITV